MILFRLGKLRDALRRASCVALAALISLNLTFPAFAASGQFQTVGWAETVSSFLMSCGIYPYDTDENGNFTEWSAQSLTALWDEFQKDVTGVAYDIVDITSSLAKGVIAIASGRWSVLREFATWIVNKYSVTDNQTGVKLGGTVKGLIKVPTTSPGIMIYDGIYKKARYYTHTDGVYIAFFGGGGGYARAVSYSPFQLISTASGPSGGASGGVSGVQNLDGVQYYGLTDSSIAYSFSDFEPGRMPYLDEMELYGSAQALDRAFLNGDFAGSFGVIADTTTVSIPDALPEGAQFGGLTVQGAGEGVTLEQLQELIRDAVQDALKPAVNVVPVVVAPDVDVNANGEISADLDINPSTVPMTASDYSAPNITGVFPFSIPWDVIAVFSALNAEPVRPDFEVSIYVPVLDIHAPFHIGVNARDAEAVDSAFAVWRNMLLVLMCVGTLILFAKMLL